VNAYARSVVEAVVATILTDIERPARPLPDSDAFALDFVLGQIERMPAHLRAALLTLEYAFEAGALARHGRPFRKLGPSERRAYLAAWQRAPLGPLRDFVRFHRSLLTFALFSRRERGA